MSTFFTQDVLVQAYVMKCIALTSVCMLMDSMITVSIGVIKGIGKQAQATLAYVICFYLIGVPSSYAFCFLYNQGLLGLWEGLAAGLAILLLSLFLIIKKADWAAIAEQARQNYLKETLIFRASTLIDLEASTTHRRNVRIAGSSSDSQGSDDEEERSSSICLNE